MSRAGSALHLYVVGISSAICLQIPNSFAPDPAIFHQVTVYLVALVRSKVKRRIDSTEFKILF
jgi:hypothetical protein